MGAIFCFTSSSIKERSKYLHGGEEVLEIILVRLAVNNAAAALVEVKILLGTHQPKLLALVLADQ